MCEACGQSHASDTCSHTTPRSQTTPRHPSCDPALPASPGARGLAPGTMVGEYEVTHLLGSGGMGLVYAGRHPLLGRPVAIKIIGDQAADSEHAAARFLQEARAASALSHRNIVDVFAFGRLSDGRYYQVMELLEGETLRPIGQRRPLLALPLIRVIMRGLLSALDATHRIGVIHRDIKPENVFVVGSLEGPPEQLEVKVLDFGLAKPIVNKDQLVKSRVGVAVGTPAYMSPEQCRALATADGRADLYAAAVILYELLTGRAPFRAGSAVEIMSHQIKTAPRSPSRWAPVPPGVEAVVMRGLEKAPADRYQTATEMLTALEQAFGGLKDSSEANQPRFPLPSPAPAVAAEPLPSPGRAVRSWRRWRAPGLAVAGAVALSVLLLAATRRPQAPSLAPSPPSLAPTSLSPDQRARGYLEQAERLMLERRFQEANDALAKAGALDITDPSLNIRLVSVRHDVKGALEGDQDNAEAITLPAPARGARQPAKGPTPGPPRAQPRRMAALSVNATPPGMVYLDDEPIGRAPIRQRQVSAGKHTLQVRFRGYRPYRSEIILTAGKDSAIAATLEFEAGAALRDRVPDEDSVRLASTTTAPASSDWNGDAKSARPNAKFRKTDLPRIVEARSDDELQSVCRTVEGQTVSLAGVSPDFAQGVSLLLQQALRGQSGASVYPAGMYYFIIAEAARGRDKRTAARNLLAGHRDGSLRKLSAL